jgi:RNA polymerase-associated protein RTF1
MQRKLNDIMYQLSYTKLFLFSATDSSLIPAETSGKPLAKLVTLSKDALNVGQATSYQTDYEKLVSRVALEIHIELLEDTED